MSDETQPIPVEQSPAPEAVEPIQESPSDAQSPEQPTSLDVGQEPPAPEADLGPIVGSEPVLEVEPEPEAVPTAAPVSAPPAPAPEPFKLRAGVNCVVDGGQVKPL